MGNARTSGLVIRRPSKYLFFTCCFSLAVTMSLAIFIYDPSPDVGAITPPDTCFAFDTGTGTITDYYSNESNNAANPACPKAVEIPDAIGGVTVANIGVSGFNNNQLTSITIPNNVTSISNYAFGSNRLASLTIPSSVTSIGMYAFSGNLLTSLAIPDTVTSVGDGAFSSNRLTNITFPSGMTSIGYSTFSYNQLASLTIPSSVTSIGDYAFSNNQLTSVILPSSVTIIGDGAFYGNELSVLSIPASVTNVGNGAFNNNKLTSPVIAGSPAGGNVFEDNPLTSISYNGTAYPVPVASSTSVTPPEACFGFNSGTGEITSYRLFGLAALQLGVLCTDRSVIIPGTIGGTPVTSIGDTAFYNDKLASITIPSGVTSIGASAFQSNYLTSVAVPSGVTSIGNAAFYGNKLNSLTIPAGITTISNNAFSNNRLTSLTIPSGVISIGDSAFYDNQLASINLPNSVTSIGSNAFYGNRLASLTIPSGVISIESGAFQDNKLTALTIPANVTSIGSTAFSNNQLASLIIPNSLTTISDYVFQGNSLSSITIPNSVTSIGNGAFSWNKLTSLTIPASVTSIADYAFHGNSLTTPIILGSPTGTKVFGANPIESISYDGIVYAKPAETSTPVTPPDACFGFDAGTGTITSYDPFSLTVLKTGIACMYENIDIPSTIGGVAVTNIGSYSLYDNQFTGISIPNSVTSIESGAFSDNSLTVVTIPGSITSIGTYAFYGNKLTNLVIPAGVISIGNSAFSSNQLTSLTVSASVTSIGDEAFSGNKLTDPVILGSPTGKRIFPDNPLASISYNGTVHTVPTVSPTPVTPVDSCFDIDSLTGEITEYKLFSLTALKAGTFCVERNIIVPRTINGVTVTGESGNAAFYDLGLTGLSLPDTISEEIAASNNYLTNFTLPTSLTEMGDYMYSYDSLARLTIPAGVTFIDPAAMMGQSPWGRDVASGVHPDKDIYTTDPAVRQHVYDNLWYVRAYTENPSNPHNLSDYAFSESWETGDDGNQNGTQSDSLGGHIINPASTVIHYKDSAGKTVAPDVTVTGLKTGKTPSSSLDSGDYLHTYLAGESAISAPLDPYNNPDPQEVAEMKVGFEQYYRMGDIISFSPKSIPGYITPNTKSVALSAEDNVVTFTYKPFVTSIPFMNGTVVDGSLTTTPPPAGAQSPLIAKSSLNIGNDPQSNDCTNILSANLLSASAITSSDIPPNVTILGGVDYSLACSSGGKARVDYVLGSTVPDVSKLSVFKYDSTTHQLTNITKQVTVSTKTADGTARTVVGYTLSDGGNLDEDNQINGIIKDPLVIGYQGSLTESDRLADTGSNLWAIVAVPAVSILVGGGLVLVNSRKRPWRARAN